MKDLCAIIAGGDMNDAYHLTSKELFNDFKCVICADSGYKHAKRLGIVPDIIVGDFDSYDGELPQNAEIIRSVPEKDDTDTLMAVKKAIEIGCKTIFLFGALGGKRIEHTIANIQTMIYAHEQGCRIYIRSDDSVLRTQSAEDGEVKYNNNSNGKYISVFALTESVDIEYMRGMKYPLENYHMVQSFPIGVSNEIIGKSACIKVKSGLALVIETKKLST
ncbi:MAG: thiamine diphosphokinase [Ruminococcus sp.]|nr:thiamine diphosphokinase [Ruminococcus sp.]